MPGYPCCCAEEEAYRIDCDSAEGTYPYIYLDFDSVDLAPCAQNSPIYGESWIILESDIADINDETFTLDQCDTDPCIYFYEGSFGDFIMRVYGSSDSCSGSYDEYDLKLIIRVWFTVTAGGFNAWVMAFLVTEGGGAYHLFVDTFFVSGDTIDTETSGTNEANYWDAWAHTDLPYTDQDCLSEDPDSGIYIGKNGTATLTAPSSAEIINPLLWFSWSRILTR